MTTTEKLAFDIIEISSGFLATDTEAMVGLTELVAERNRPLATLVYTRLYDA